MPVENEIPAIEAPDRDVPGQFLRRISDWPFVGLDEAINYILLGGTATSDHRSDMNVFVQDPALAVSGAMLQGSNTDDRAAIRWDLDKNMSRGMASGELKFHGIKCRVGEDGPTLATNHLPIAAIYGASIRGFSEEDCRITAVSLFASAQELSDWEEKALENSENTFEWTNVVLERDSFLQWVTRKYPSVLKGKNLRWASEETLYELLRARYTRDGAALKMNALEAELRDDGRCFDRDMYRTIYRAVTGHTKRGPRGPRTSKQKSDAD